MSIGITLDLGSEVIKRLESFREAFINVSDMMFNESLNVFWITIESFFMITDVSE